MGDLVKKQFNVGTGNQIGREFKLYSFDKAKHNDQLPGFTTHTVVYLNILSLIFHFHGYL